MSCMTLLQILNNFNGKKKITGNTPPDVNTKNVEIAVPLKYPSSIWRTLEMSLIEINLILTWSSTCYY